MPARPGAGRPKGAPNKATKEIKALAQEYAPAAMKELARLSKNAKSEQARCTAIGMLLDRGYGKATQVIAGDKENPVHLIVEAAGAALDGKLARLVNGRDTPAAG